MAERVAVSERRLERDVQVERKVILERLFLYMKMENQRRGSTFSGVSLRVGTFEISGSRALMMELSFKYSITIKRQRIDILGK